MRLATNGRRACLLGAAALAASAAMAGSASTAQASCGGNLIEAIPIREGSAINRVGDGQLLGWFNLYYSNATGYNCARTVSSDLTWGKRKLMEATIVKCRERTPSAECTQVERRSDSRPYKFYAGDVRVKAPKQCVFAYGFIDLDSRGNGAHWGWGSTLATAGGGNAKATHCG